MPQARIIDSRADGKALVISLHDVSPWTWGSCKQLLAELNGLGITRTSLLVIPDHHGRGHFLREPAFCEWLQAQVAAGHEAVLHGYHHRREARSGESVRDRWITRHYTAGEGEFFDLAYDRARELAQRGVEDLKQIGLSPAGFIAPAWLLGAEAERAIRDLGFAYTTRIGGILDLRTGHFHPSQSLCWSVRAAWRRGASLAWNAWLYRRLAQCPVLRIAIHPVDVGHPRILRQISRLAGGAGRCRSPHTYQSWLAGSGATRRGA